MNDRDLLLVIGFPRLLQGVDFDSVSLTRIQQLPLTHTCSDYWDR